MAMFVGETEVFGADVGRFAKPHIETPEVRKCRYTVEITSSPFGEKE
jgi:hypothetical protein